MGFFGQTKYERNSGARNRERAQQDADRQLARDKESAAALGGAQKSILSGTEKEQKGQLAGLNVANIGYGQGLKQTGDDIQRVKKLQRDRTNQSGGDAVSAAVQGQGASSLANTQRSLQSQNIKGGASLEAQEAMRRKSDQSTAATLYGQQQSSISDERSLASNMLGGTIGQMNVGAAGGVQQPGGPPKASGMFDSVICTELNRQGLMSDDMWKADMAYGKYVFSVAPEMIIGYHAWGRPTVKLMKKSPLFSTLISYPVLSWSRYISTGKFSLTGLFVTSFVMPICGIIGNLKLKLNKFSGASNVR
jgi:hypothetical protein